MARLLVLTVMVKKIGYMGAIISRNMAISLRTSAKSLGEGSEVTGHKEETSIMADSPSSLPLLPLSHPSSPPLLCITVQFAPVGDKRLCQVRTKENAVGCKGALLHHGEV